jgi:hypothetical protein
MNTRSYCKQKGRRINGAKFVPGDKNKKKIKELTINEY